MYKINKNYFSKIDNSEKAYFLGLLFADGNNYISKSVKQVSIELLLEDVKIIKILQEKIQTDKPIKYRKAKVDKNNFKIKERCGLVLSNAQISDDLKNHGCVSKKTFKLKFPEEKTLDKDFFYAFIRGYFDGDGCISISKNNQIKSSISGFSPFIKKVYEILKNNNINVKIYKHRKIKNFLEIYIQGVKDNIDLYNYLYDESELFLDRKKEKFIKILTFKKGQG